MQPIYESDQRENSQSDPVFRAPWEATAFAIVNHLTATEQCTWKEWTEQLAQEISIAEAHAAEAHAAEASTYTASAYYEHWVSACEKMLISKGLLAPTAIARKIEEIAAERERNHH